MNRNVRRVYRSHWVDSILLTAAEAEAAGDMELVEECPECGRPYHRGSGPKCPKCAEINACPVCRAVWPEERSACPYCGWSAAGTRHGFADADTIVTSWNIEDVLAVADDLSIEEAREVLARVLDYFDASVGISFDTLEYWAGEVRAEREDTT